MAKFCRFCGAPLEEGQVCTCPGAQAAQNPAPAQPAAPVQPAAPASAAQEWAPAAAPQAPAGNSAAAELFGELKDVLLGYLSAPKKAIKAAVESKKGMAMAGILAGVHALALFFFFWSMLGKLIGSLKSSLGILGSAVGALVKIGMPIFPLLLTGIVLAVVCIGLSAVALMVCGKLTKRELTIQQTLVVAAVSSIYPTVVLLAGALLGLMSSWLHVACLVLALLIWVINAVSDIRDYTGLNATVSLKNMIMVAVVLLVVAVVSALVLYGMGKYCIGEVSIAGAKLKDGLAGLLSGGLGGLGDLFG